MHNLRSPRAEFATGFADCSQRDPSQFFPFDHRPPDFTCQDTRQPLSPANKRDSAELSLVATSENPLRYGFLEVGGAIKDPCRLALTSLFPICISNCFKQ